MRQVLTGRPGMACLNGLMRSGGSEMGRSGVARRVADGIV